MYLVCRLLLEKKHRSIVVPATRRGVKHTSPGWTRRQTDHDRPILAYRKNDRNCQDLHLLFLLFFFNDTATTEIYTLSLHDALPIYAQPKLQLRAGRLGAHPRRGDGQQDRKSTRLNSSHVEISYAVFCLKKKKQ